MVYYLITAEGRTSFEFDEAKSASNAEKHGINFHQAQQLWADPSRIRLPARSLDEERFMVVGRIGSEYWTAFMTMRGERVRLISVRRARRQEVAAYGRVDG